DKFCLVSCLNKCPNLLDHYIGDIEGQNTQWQPSVYSLSENGGKDLPAVVRFSHRTSETLSAYGLSYESKRIIRHYERGRSL
ncbi:hypothetical protein, partial [Legionella quinlivanii]|uniref:hypothetical protein n=1 Tax=Legionella quinlivanii TaxID=45073 RepID=UPI001A951245